MDYLSPGNSGILKQRKPKPAPAPKGFGLGDLVALVAKRTGIARISKAISKKTGRDCGCEKRRATLNRLKFHK
tara:strand:+ start:3246 stop:3464 length:219 start_codon:yes stop_codon:yes gene_type:complete